MFNEVTYFMNKMNKNQILCMLGMIICMISTDILICLSNPILQRIGYICLFGVVIFIIIYIRETHKKHKQEDEELARKVLSIDKTEEKKHKK